MRGRARGLAAGDASAIDHEHGHAGNGEVVRGREPGDARAHHDHIDLFAVAHLGFQIRRFSPDVFDP